ncbi:MAG: pyridoxamine 5'-phosphate oxidase family protein [Oscillospiraceae bacterium]|nr:pyridoxamine 5'-phosphate oxidase family protein [Oscillospiraceae bacterium]
MNGGLHINSNIFAKANQIIKTCDAAYFGVIDEDGFPSVCTVSPTKTENILEIYFSTNIGNNKEKRLRNNNRASVCFRSDGNNITLVGEAEILNDQKTKSLHWLDWFKDHYQGGETDPNYIIIKLRTKRASLWIDNESAEFLIDELLTVQSRCGLLCKWCKYKEPMNCPGCLALNGKASWCDDYCDVSKCCIDKGYFHCGECPDVPCENLRGLSYGDDEHNDKPEGARIAVCRAWAKN